MIGLKKTPMSMFSGLIYVEKLDQPSGITSNCSDGPVGIEVKPANAE